MPKNKSAILRYRIIDACLTNKRRKYPSLEYIQEKIEEQLNDSISISMLNKDFSDMRTNFGAPIAYCKTNKGYYYSEPGFSIKEFPLTSEEVEALDFSTAILQQIRGSRMFMHFESAINKMIEGYRISKIIGKSEQQLLQIEEPVKHSEQPWLEQLLTAILEKQLLLVTYQVFGREEKQHPFSPYLLKEYRNRWYVVGYSERAKNVLVMGLDRIRAVEQMNGVYHNAQYFDAQAFFQYSFGITQVNGANAETVILSFSKEQAHYIHTQPLHHSQQLYKETKEDTWFKYEVYITHELLMTILSYGSAVMVVQPVHLKEKIYTMAKETALRYEVGK